MLWPDKYTETQNTLNRLANNEFGEIASWLHANEQESLTKGLGRNSVRHACDAITDPTGCWGTDPKNLGNCKPCKEYADKLASLASHVVDLCYEMTEGLTKTMKNDITMCCLGGIQTESTQRVTRRAAYYVDIENITTPEGRDMEVDAAW